MNYTEGRFYPYFFPDSLNDDEKATEYYKNNYASIRRALLREPIDRMGFGGYLKIASKFPKFCQTVAKTTEEFRQIYDLAKGQNPYNAVSVAILNYWGREMSWMTQNVYIDAPTQKNYPYLGVLEALAGLPVKVTFLSFADLQAQDLSSYDVVINYGYAGTAFTGDTEWKNADTVAKIREYVYNGGGFIGIGEPSSVLYGGKFFQLSDCMGVEKETGLTAMYSKNIKVEREHFITADVAGEIDYAGGADDVYPTTATVLDAYYPDAFKSGVNCGHVRMAVNDYGKGRSFYMSGMGKTADNFRLFYRAMLWCAHKENELKKAYSENPNTECHYYTKSGKYAVVNNTDEEQKTKVYDVAGKPQTLTLASFELRII